MKESHLRRINEAITAKKYAIAAKYIEHMIEQEPILANKCSIFYTLIRLEKSWARDKKAELNKHMRLLTSLKAKTFSKKYQDNNHSSLDFFRILVFLETPLHLKLFIRLFGLDDGDNVSIIALPNIHQELYNQLRKLKTNREIILASASSSFNASCEMDIQETISNAEFDLFLNFNDGTNATKRLLKHIDDKKIITIQDGYLGHEREFNADFNKVHYQNLKSKSISYLSKVDKKTLDLYTHNVYKCKIGTSRKGQYIYTDKDTAVKSSIIHSIAPDRVHLGSWNSTHQPLKKHNHQLDYSENRDIQMLYIGQCHSHHGHMSEEAYIDHLRDIFNIKELYPYNLSYRFHPGEPERLRDKIRMIAKESCVDCQIPEDHDLNLEDYDVYIIDNSSMAYSIAQCMRNVIVIKDGNPNMQLPYVLSDFIHFTSKKNLPNVVHSLHTDNNIQNGIPTIEDMPEISDYFGESIDIRKCLNNTIATSIN